MSKEFTKEQMDLAKRDIDGWIGRLEAGGKKEQAAEMRALHEQDDGLTYTFCEQIVKGNLEALAP